MMLLRSSDRVLERGITALLICTPLAFGTVQKWSVSLLEIVAFLLLLLFLLKRTYFGSAESNVASGFDLQSPDSVTSAPFKQRSLKAAAIVVMLFVGTVLLQLVPLPDAILQFISPNSLRVYQKLAGTTTSFHTISVNRYATRQELLLLLAYVSIFIVIVGHYRTTAQLRSLVTTIFRIGCFLVLFALVQKISWNGRMFWVYPVEEYLRSGSGIWGPYINRNHFAGYLEMIIPFGLGLLVYTAPGSTSSAGASYRSRIAGFLASPTFALFTFSFVAVLIMTAALFATLSRGGIAACVVSFTFFVAITRTRRSLKSRSLLISMLALIISSLVVFAAWDRIEGRFDEGGYIDRATVWRDSVGILRDYPLLGSGLGCFESTYLRYQTRYNRTLYDHAHNDYIELMTDTGLVGSLLVGAATLLCIPALYRRWKIRKSRYVQAIGASSLAAMLAMAIHSFTDFNLHIPANALLVTVVVAISFVALFNVSDSRTASLRDRETADYGSGNAAASGTIASRIALVLVCALLLFFPCTSLLADYHSARIALILDDPATDYLDSKPLLLATLPDYRRALDAAEQAFFIEPGRAQYAATLAEQYTRFGRWAAALEVAGLTIPADAPKSEFSFNLAERYLQAAIRLEPTNPDYHLALADLFEVYRHDPPRADVELKRAVAAFPFNGAVRYAVAMHYLLAGRTDDALAQARQLAQMDDSYILNDSPRKIETLERMPEWYMEQLKRSYLFSALEIAWRITRDPLVVKSMAPDYSPEALLVLVAFLDSKGIDLPE